MAFWDSFEAAIHNNDELSSVDKFNYLNTLLEDSAAAAVAGLTLTSANYGEAVEILKKRFGNKQMIIAKHMDILMNLEAVSSQHDLKGLRHLYNLVESHTRGLASLGVPSSSYGALLSSVLITKLPQEFRLTVSREIKEGEWDLSAVMKILDRETDARERAAANPGTCRNKKMTEALQPQLLSCQLTLLSTVSIVIRFIFHPSAETLQMLKRGNRYCSGLDVALCALRTVM